MNREESAPVVRSRRNLPRASQACQACRVKKVRCDQRHPCGYCVKNGFKCDFVDNNRRRRQQQRNSTSSAVNPSPHQDPSSARRSQLAPSIDSSITVTHTDDVLGDVNQHTKGTEFYGTSSNLVLLNQLFAYARKVRQVSSNDKSASPAFLGTRDNVPATSQLSPTNTSVGGHISIINLLANEDALIPPPRTLSGRRAPLHEHNLESSAAPSQSASTTPPPPTALASRSDPAGYLHRDSSIRAARLRLEKECFRSYLRNLHYIHPMLDPADITARCESSVWTADGTTTPGNQHLHALCYIIVAVGALVAGPELSEHLFQDAAILRQPKLNSDGIRSTSSPQSISKSYFRKSRALLGDVFEVCSLESAQTLLLMSLYCQNSLKPHGCYMYCGMAVRTALSIGLTSKSIARSPEEQDAASRTWWCIYSHEIDMCCSAGRRDSLRKPGSYNIPQPVIQDVNHIDGNSSASAPHAVAMVGVMVNYAAIIRRVSKHIYHDDQGLDTERRSSLAHQIGAELEGWKNSLPSWLQFESVSLRETEAASKQKLVLKIRYLNAQILLHRLFLPDSASGDASQEGTHLAICLRAARETIGLLHGAYANRLYFRTWWYNTTYTLYASMILLYIILLGHIALEDLQCIVGDVRKSHEVLVSMKESTVASQSAELVAELLEVAQSRMEQQKRMVDGASTVAQTAMPTEATARNSRPTHGAAFRLQEAVVQGLSPGNGVPNIAEDWLATLIDPDLLQTFTASLDDASWSVPSTWNDYDHEGFRAQLSSDLSMGL